MTDTTSSSVCDRRLPLSGAANFRDLGGYLTADRHSVRNGLVYRSDHLSRLTMEDHEILQRLRFKVVCDLRTIREQERDPDLLPPNGSLRLLSLPILANGFDPATAIDRLRRGDNSWLSMDFFIRLYRHYLDDFGPVWGMILRLVASPANLPLVFHCTGGKDRTGICAALLLKVLNVQEEDIFLDHELSNHCNAERLKFIYNKFEILGIEPQKSALYLQALSEPLIAMFDHLKEKYGTVEDYLRIKANLDGQTLSSIRTCLLK